MNQPMDLPLEKQFNIRSFESQVDRMTLEQAQHFLKQIYTQMILRETMYQDFLKHKWGLESGPSLE